MLSLANWAALVDLPEPDNPVMNNIFLLPGLHLSKSCSISSAWIKIFSFNTDDSVMDFIVFSFTKTQGEGERITREYFENNYSGRKDWSSIGDNRK